jgi:hypothetical protein
MKTAITSSAAAVILAACGGGGGGGDPELQEGLYQGSSLANLLPAAARPGSVLVLENQEAWVLLQPTNDVFPPGLFGQGSVKHSGTGRTFTADKALVAMGSAALQERALSLEEVSPASVQVTVPGTTVPPLTATRSTPATGYDFDRAARIADIAGVWDPRMVGATFSINDTGALAASGLRTAAAMSGPLSDPCSLTGTVTPRPGGKNVFNVAFTVAGCPDAGAYTGVAVTYLNAPEGGTTGGFTVPTLRLMGINADRTKVYSRSLLR